MMVKVKGINVSISTIYYWIHHGYLGLTEADMLYPRKVKAKKKQASPDFKSAGKSIEERPEIINKRENVGDFEIDTVIQTRAQNECLLTLTDRKSRYQIIRLIPDKSAELVNQALSTILKDYQIHSITADNGTEFSRLADVFDPEHIYYAHPYSSWKGEPMKIIIDSSVVCCLREAKMRPKNKSHSLKIGLTTIQRKY